MIVKRQKKSGVAFIMALAIMFMLLSLGMAYVIIARSQAVVVSNQGDALKAFYIAEAGAEEALNQLFTDSGWGDGFTDISFAGGVYNVSLLEDKYGIIEITSVGTFGGAERTLRTEVLVINPASVTELLGTTVGAGGEATFAGSSGTIKGVVVTEGEFTQGNMNIDDARIVDKFEDLPEVEVDFKEYKKDADVVIDTKGKKKEKGEKGKPESEAYKFTKSESPYTGIYYIEGDGGAIIESGVIINGTIISEDNITFEDEDKSPVDSVTITAEGGTPVEGYPAIITQGKIDMDGMAKTDITGLVYAEEDINMDDANDVTFLGGIIAGKDLNARDGEELIIDYNTEMDILPPHFTFPISDETEEGTIAVISWKAYPG